MQDNSIGYIIDFYNKYHNNDDVVKTFHLRNQNLCIRAITSFEWGQPIFPEKSIDDDYSIFHVYKTIEEAEDYIRILRHIDGSSF